MNEKEVKKKRKRKAHNNKMREGNQHENIPWVGENVIVT